MSKAKHRFKGAAKRNPYAVIMSPNIGWVRLFRLNKNEVRLFRL